jgi:hypothetical protein
MSGHKFLHQLFRRPALDAGLGFVARDLKKA